MDSFSGQLIYSIRALSTPQAVLTTDRSIYRAGETVWFNALLLNSISQKVTAKSKYLFVDLVNEKDSVIRSVLLDAAHQQLNGRIILPDAIPQGYYWIRAFTRQMAQGDSSKCSIRSIYIFNADNNTSTRRKSSGLINDGKLNNPLIEFYPEGGSLITGANSIVAIHIHDKQYQPIAADGFIKDNTNSIVTPFTVAKNGIGKFIFSPLRNRQYKAYIIWNDKEINYPLPAFNFKAAQLSVTNPSAGKRLVRVLLEDSIYSKDFLTYVIAISKDSLCFAGIGRGQYEVLVPEEKFPEGIATFYLYDKNFNLLSERSIYVKENNLKINAAVDKISYAKRDKVELNISVNDKNHQSIPALFSVAVVDSIFSDPSENCVLPSFNGMSKQKIFNNFFLARLQCLSNEELDLLMLLNDKTYNRINRNSLRTLLADDKDSLLFIKGVVLNEKNEPAGNKLVSLLSNSGNGIFITDTTDSYGRFYFPVENYADSTQFSLTAKNLNGRNLQTKIKLDPINIPLFKTPVSLKHYLAEPVIMKYYQAYLNNDFEATGKQKLPPITVKTQRAVNYDVSKRVSPYSSILTSSDIDEGSSVGSAILKVSGVQILNGYLVINGYSSMNGPSIRSEPMVIVDGQQVPINGVGADGNISPTMAYLNSISGKEIDFIEVLKGAEASNYGVRGGNGVILINTSRNVRNNIKGDGYKYLFYATGIQNPPLFPIVDYDNKNIKIPMFDNRSTIFWDGSVLSGDQKNAVLSFYTSDIPSTYKIIISGITIHGDIVYKTLSFKSK